MIRCSQALSAAFLALWAASVVACSDDPVVVPPSGDAGVAPDGSVGRPDATADSGVVRPDSGTDGGMTTPDSGPVTTACNNPPIPDPTSGSCNFTAGTGDATLIRGNLVAPEGYLENAHLLIDAEGVILCAACDCSASAGFATARRIECKDGVVSPGLINAHDHITFNVPAPPASRTERYEHRHDWRRGNNGHTRIPSPSTAGGENAIRWSELRNLMAGGTAVNGSGSAAGLIRNLDRAQHLEGLNQPAVRYQTFPLDDNDGTTRTMDCNYGMGDTPGDIANVDAYTPHIAEGINLEAQNEFQCLSGAAAGAVDLVTRKTALIHGVGLEPQEFGTMATVGASLIWSPRSNIDLYGHTALVTTARRMGVRIALGTDWVATGSINMLRELRCADDYNRLFLAGAFSDRDLVDMATIAAAEALASDDLIGSLRAGRQADVSIFDGRSNRGYRAVLDAEPDDVVLVMRGGDILYGDDGLVASALGGGDGCEAVDVCGRAKSLCLMRDTGVTLDAVRGALTDPYALFFCGEPTGEPTCLPSRPNEFTGMSRMGDADGDGMLDMNDNCPNVFNPPRPLDNNVQGDADGDMTGDACDVCPLDANSTTCSAANPNDRDGDGAPNATDNCPNDANADQLDSDRDMTGDVCDACPMVANPGGAACPVTIYAMKQGTANGAVLIRGVVVTAVASLGYFVQAVQGTPAYDAVLGADYSATFVFTGAGGMKPAVGDMVDVSGSTTVFNGQRELERSSFVVTMAGATLPAPLVVLPAEVATGGMRAEELEGVLLEVQGVTVTSIDPPLGMGDTAPSNEFVVAGSLRVNDYMYRVMPSPRVGTTYGFVRGVLRIANGDYKLEPRTAADVASPPQLSALTPATPFLALGRTATLTAVLTRTTTQTTVVSLMASSGDLSVPMAVTIASGADRASFVVRALAATTGAPTVVTASLGMVSVTTSIRVYDDAAPRRIVALELDATALPLGGMTTGRFALDLPAPAGGLPVRLAVTPGARGSVMPRTATVAAGVADAAFLLIVGTSTGTGRVEATLGAQTATVAFSVSASQTRPAQNAGDLVITEILINVQGSTEAGREWFEVYNPTTDTLTLGGLIVADSAGQVTAAMMSGEIAPGGYRVFATSAAAASNGGLMNAIAFNLALNNGNDRVQLRRGNTVIDEVTWAMGWPGGDGVAICLRAPYGDNSVPASWGTSVGTYGPNPDTGSPGVASNATNCP